MTGMAAGNAHWTVHSEGERGGTSDKVITAIGAASLRRSDHGEVLVVGIARGHAQHVYIFSGRVKFRLMIEQAQRSESYLGCMTTVRFPATL